MASKLSEVTFPAFTFVIFVLSATPYPGWIVEIFILSPTFPLPSVKFPLPSVIGCSKFLSVTLKNLIFLLLSFGSIFLTSWTFGSPSLSNINAIGEFVWTSTLFVVPTFAIKLLTCLRFTPSVSASPSATFFILAPPKSTPSFLKLTFLPFPPIELIPFSSLLKA